MKSKGQLDKTNYDVLAEMQPDLLVQIEKYLRVKTAKSFESLIRRSYGKKVNNSHALLVIIGAAYHIERVGQSRQEPEQEHKP